MIVTTIKVLKEVFQTVSAASSAYAAFQFQNQVCSVAGKATTAMKTATRVVIVAGVATTVFSTCGMVFSLKHHFTIKGLQKQLKHHQRLTDVEDGANKARIAELEAQLQEVTQITLTNRESIRALDELRIRKHLDHRQNPQDPPPNPQPQARATRTQQNSQQQQQQRFNNGNDPLQALWERW